MSEKGIVSCIENGVATISFNMGEACFGCEAQGDCAVRDRSIKARVIPGLEVKIGDFVLIHIKKSIKLMGVLWLLVLPLSLFVAGYWILRANGQAESVAGLAGIGGFGLGLLLAALMGKKSAGLPEISQILPPEEKAACFGD